MKYKKYFNQKEMIVNVLHTIPHEIPIGIQLWFRIDFFYINQIYHMIIPSIFNGSGLLINSFVGERIPYACECRKLTYSLIR